VAGFGPIGSGPAIRRSRTRNDRSWRCGGRHLVHRESAEIGRDGHGPHDGGM